MKNRNLFVPFARVMIVIIFIVMPNIGWGVTCGQLNVSGTLSQTNSNNIILAGPCGPAPSSNCPSDGALCANGVVYSGQKDGTSWVCANDRNGNGNINCANPAAIAARDGAQATAQVTTSCGTAAPWCLNGTSLYGGAPTPDDNNVYSWKCTATVGAQTSAPKQCQYSLDIFSSKKGTDLVLQNSGGSATISQSGGLTAQDDIKTQGAVQVGSVFGLVWAACAQTQAGAIKFDTTITPGQFIGCNGSTWKGLLGGRITSYAATSACNAGDIMTSCTFVNNPGNVCGGGIANNRCDYGGGCTNGPYRPQSTCIHIE